MNKTRKEQLTSTGDETNPINQDWDLQSPLIDSQISHNNNDTSNSSADGLQYENFAIETSTSLAKSDSDFACVDPVQLFLVTSSITLCLLFSGLWFGSFFYPWSDTIMEVTMINQNSRLFDIDFNLPLFKDATFFDTLNIFNGSDSKFLSFSILLTSIIAPLFWLLYLSLLIKSHLSWNRRIESSHDNEQNTVGKNGYEILKSELKDYIQFENLASRVYTLHRIPLHFMKLSMCIVYINSIIMIAISNVSLKVGGNFSPVNNGEDHFIRTRVESNIRGGMTSFIAGITFCTLSFMTLKQMIERFEYQAKDVYEESDSDNDRPDNDGNSSVIFSPPPRAFNHFLSDESFILNESIDDANDFSTPLLRRLTREVEEHPLQQISNGMNGGNVKNEARMIVTTRRHLTLVYEIGLLAVLTAIPLTTSPLVTFKYSGILSPVFNDGITVKQQTMTLLDIVVSITKKNGTGFFPFFASSLLWINVIIIPLMTWACCGISVLLTTFAKDTSTIQRVNSFAYFFHPLYHLESFVASLATCIVSIGKVSSFLFNQNQVCYAISKIFIEGDPCMILEARLEKEIAYLIAHVVLVNLYLHLVKKDNTETKY